MRSSRATGYYQRWRWQALVWMPVLDLVLILPMAKDAAAFAKPGPGPRNYLKETFTRAAQKLAMCARLHCNDQVTSSHETIHSSNETS